MSPTRSSRIAAAVIIGLAPAISWIAATTAPDGERLPEFIAAAIVFGLPLSIAAGIVVHRLTSFSDADDWAERLLCFGTADLDGPRTEWGAAMRAELASIDDPRERRRFALGCIRAAVRAEIGGGVWQIALGTGVVFALGTYGVSRLSLASGRGGVAGVTLVVPIALLFALSLVTAISTRSLPTGMIVGWVALLAGLVAVLGVAVAEAGHWYDIAGVYIMDGDAPKGGINRIDAVFDPIGPPFALFHLLLWAPWPVIGAAIGSRASVRRRMEPQRQRR